MKNFLISFINQPKKATTAALAIALILGALFYRSVGRAPVVNLPENTMTQSATNSSTNTLTDLAFPKAGRVAVVSVKAGDTVKKGELLASLDAGDAEGAVNQAKGALELAQAQYASLDIGYQNAKKQQDVLVSNAWRTLLSSNLAAVPSEDDSHTPIISGTYACDKEGNYVISTYGAASDSGFGFTYSGLEQGNGAVVTYSQPQPLGSCGLYVQFIQGFSGSTKWTVAIPNIKSANYVANKNAYDLAVSTRDQTLSQLAANIGANSSSGANTAKASIDAAEGAYQAALGAYQNDIIVAPADGTVTFVDGNLKVGQSVAANKTVISISAK